MSNNFDDLLRKKWEEKNFPVDPDHRQEMINLLEKNGRRKVGFFWWIGGLLMAVSVMSAVFYLNSYHSTPINLKHTPVNSASPDNIIAQTEKNTDSEMNNDATTAKEVGKINSIQKENHQNNALTKKPSSNSQNNQAKSSISYSNKSSNHSSSSHSKKNIDVSTRNGNIFPSAPNVNHSDAIVIPQHSPVYVSGAISVVVEPDDAVIENQESANVQRNSSVTQPVHSLVISDVDYSNADFIGAITPSATYHSIRLFGETGAGFIPSKNNEYSAGWTFNVGGGLSYKLGANTSLLFSMGYLFQDGGFYFQKTSAVQQPAFGVRSNFNVLHADKLHFVYSKFGMQYELKRNLFSAYGGLQYLYGAQGTIVVKTVDQFTGVKEIPQYAWLSTDGMRHFLWNVEVLYGYRITPRMTIRAGVKYHFSSIDIKDSTLSDEGYTWNGHYSSFTPSFIVNYHLYGNR